MRNSAGSNDVRRHSRARIIPFAVILVGLVALVATSIGSARARPKCFGKTATIVGSNGSNTISGTPHADVIAALGGNDTIKVNGHDADPGKDIVCGDGGNDKITGSPPKEVLIGGPGNDKITAGNGADLVVGDNANPSGNESGPTGRDDLATAGDRDFVVGDNYAGGPGNAMGANSGDDLRAAGGGDTVVADSAAVGTGDATGGADDRMGGASGNDLVIGDSYAKSGVATGGGDDDNNSGPGKDLAVGDSYTKTGLAVGGGRDSVSAADGGDFDEICKPANSCSDTFYGDGYAAECGPKPTLAAIACQAEHTQGGAPDTMQTDQGDDFMNAGLPDPDDIPGTGKTVDRCDGGSGRDIGTRCKPIQRGFEVNIPFVTP